MAEGEEEGEMAGVRGHGACRPCSLLMSSVWGPAQI